MSAFRLYYIWQFTHSQWPDEEKKYTYIVLPWRKRKLRKANGPESQTCPLQISSSFQTMHCSRIPTSFLVIVTWAFSILEQRSQTVSSRILTQLSPNLEGPSAMGGFQVSWFAKPLSVCELQSSFVFMPFNLDYPIILLSLLLTREWNSKDTKGLVVWKSMTRSSF